MRKEWPKVLVAMLVAVGAVACDPVQDPWVSGDQFAAERQRSAAQADELRQRMTNVQTDR